MATLGELFFGRELVELMDEMEEALEFLELFEEDKTIDEKEITLTIKTKNTKGEIQTADLTIPPEMERYVKNEIRDILAFKAACLLGCCVKARKETIEVIERQNPNG